MNDVALLTEHELLALAGLARALTSVDGRVTGDEQEAILALRAGISEGTSEEASPYRGGVPTPPLDADRWRALLERAGDTLHTEDALRAAALAVTRQESRDAIYGLVSEVAMVGSAGMAEWRALEWLADAWEIDTHDPG